MVTNSERPQPYIGVSGVVNEVQAHTIGLLAEAAGLGPERLLSLGVKATHKTQWLDVPNKYGREWYPVGDELESAVGAHSPTEVFGVALTYMDQDFVRDATYRHRFVDLLIRRGQHWLDGIQFDLLPWHTEPDMMNFLVDVRNGIGYKHAARILLQCHHDSIEQLGTKGVVRHLGEYATAGALDYVLFDTSHGKGVRLDVDYMSQLLDEAYAADALAHIGIGIAGGLDADNVRDDLPRLLEKYPATSWDAESRLHPGNAEGTRPLDMAAVARYMRASAAVVRLTNGAL